MQDRFGYPELSDDAKALILGRSAARPYRVDVGETRNAIESGNVARIRGEPGGIAANRTHYVHGPKTRREFLRHFATAKT